MRVLIALHDFFPDSVGGTQLYSYHLANELQHLGVQVELFFAEDAAAREIKRRMYDDLSCTVARKPIGPSYNLFAENDSWLDRQFANCLRRFQPDVLHINHLINLSTNIPKIAKQHDVRVVFTVNDYWLRCPRTTLLDYAERQCMRTTTAKCTWCCRKLYDSRYQFYPPRRGLVGVADIAKSAVQVPLLIGETYLNMRRRDLSVRTLAEYVDLWVVPGEFVRARMREWGLPDARIALVPYGMDTELLTSRGRGRREGRLRFGYIGAISRYKGVHVLLQAFRQFFDADLVIYGAGDEGLFGEYRDIISQENVKVAGRFSDSLKAKVYEDLDALIVPSICFEGSPLVIREAFLAGVPVICSDIGGMRELVREGQNGHHFRASSADDLRRVIRRCVENTAQLRGLKPQPGAVASIADHVRSEILPLYERLVTRGVIGG